MSTPVPEQHIVQILSAEYVAHNVRRFKLSKPAGYSFEPGQATEISINKDGWLNERRPFTFTSLDEWDHLEFTIKIYTDHDGVTNQLGEIMPGEELILHDIFGTITYKGEGVFIAGGAGLTPFIAILRRLQKDGKLGHNLLLFSNRTSQDIILKNELQVMLGRNFINTLTQETDPLYDHGKIDAEYIKTKVRDLDQYFYICGPDPMVESLRAILTSLGVKKEKIVFEEF
ncbi:FAD-binding oxidoreductase [Terrimonas sp. NA20]|uniref:FAD-binding oxidoreductase n=1 Tax=Terrimonas ginsenosidimutans TaxID=2908004 RepID=A0ABS9L0J2_9BACT|nr:FAD-binding oxidoreductase [Terrimonas ginsenosidimutans]MCG2618091.1 FAD-binding oxidoreductase [Terrimonas ginsenosidimutans]